MLPRFSRKETQPLKAISQPAGKQYSPENEMLSTMKNGIHNLAMKSNVET
jgi:hypothetical protein